MASGTIIVYLMLTSENHINPPLWLSCHATFPAGEKKCENTHLTSVSFFKLPLANNKNSSYCKCLEIRNKKTVECGFICLSSTSKILPLVQDLHHQPQVPPKHDDPFDPQLHQDLLAQQPKQRHHHQDHPKLSVPLLPAKVFCKNVGLGLEIREFI